MANQHLHSRLSRLSTIWTQVFQAHRRDDGGEAARAQRLLMERYQGAVYSYLLGAVGDEDGAHDLFQEFAVRFLRGGFRRANPGRGRFRDFVKKALINLVNDHRRREAKRHHQTLGDIEIESVAPDSHLPFLESWRRELFARAWDALAALEQPGKQPLYTVLRLRAENPRLSSNALAERVTVRLQLERSLTAVTTRKLLQRAREKLGDLLLAEVAHSLGGGKLDDVEDELIELGLIGYCRRSIERRRGF